MYVSPEWCLEGCRAVRVRVRLQKHADMPHNQVCIYPPPHTHTSVPTYTHTHANTHIHIYLHAHLCTYTFTYMYLWSIIGVCRALTNAEPGADVLIYQSQRISLCVNLFWNAICRNLNQYTPVMGKVNCYGFRHALHYHFHPKRYQAFQMWYSQLKVINSIVTRWSLVNCHLVRILCCRDNKVWIYCVCVWKHRLYVILWFWNRVK